jgi:hypothetical protein
MLAVPLVSRTANGSPKKLDRNHKTEMLDIQLSSEWYATPIAYLSDDASGETRQALLHRQLEC